MEVKYTCSRTLNKYSNFDGKSFNIYLIMHVQLKALLLLGVIMMQGPMAYAAKLSPEEESKASEKQETHEFQAEVGRLMDILINSLYTQKEIFLRELISNAADALDKLRFVSIQSPEILGETKDLEIRVEFDSEAKTVTVRDTGIGMTRADLIQNLGTIAKSGTTQFIEAIKGGSLNLIGQFGVGFYSSFLAGQKVTVVTKNNDDEQLIWESSAASQFTITPDPRGNTLGRGTEVTIHLKQDAQEFAEESTIKDLIKKYSEFINFPIFLRTWREVSKEVPIEGEEADADNGEDNKPEDSKSDDDEVEVTDDDDDTSAKKRKTRTVKERVSDWVLVNDNKAIWTRPKEEISDEEYNNFYKALSKSQDDPADWIHFKAEGEVEFTSLIYIPKRAPSDMFENYYGKAASNLKLYVRRVMITEEFEDLVPRYLNFIKGVIDSDELPLNVNRETLQQLKMLKVISRKIVRKTLEMIKKLSDADEEEGEEEEEEEEDTNDLKEEERTEEQKKKDAQERRQRKIDKYNEFFQQFGKNIKLGVIEDSANRQKLAKLTRWYSSRNTTELTSFDSYIERAKTGQDSIYFIAGEDKAQLMSSPIIEGLLKKGYEVLLLDDPVDEFTFQHLNEYEKKKLVNVGKGDFKAPEDDDLTRRKNKKLKKIFQPLTDWWRKLLAENVDSVQLSQRLVQDPIVIVSSESGYSANMERISKAQAYTNQGSSNP
jgi:heat shock protein 90kDa beta